MPEGRMLKKRISESKKLGALKSDSARLLYTWLLPHLDVEGLFSADPDIIKGYIFPKVKSMTQTKIGKLIYELAEVGLIIIYAENGEQFLKLEKFHEFQKIDPKKEGKSNYPKITKDNTLKINKKHGYSGVTLENSGVTLENSSTSKVKESKVEVKESLSKGKRETPNGVSSCPKSSPSDEDIRLCQLLIDFMSENNPKSSILKRLTKKRQQEWIDTCRLMRERDERTVEEIEAMIRFSQQDSFWKSNILSMPKLREKFDQLWLKAKKDRYSGIREWLNE